MSINGQSAAGLPSDLALACRLVYAPCNLSFEAPCPEKESSEYGAYTFSLNAHKVQFRIAKTTPKKIGQFVTLWKRLAQGPIQPFDASDAFDFCIVSVRARNLFGQFIFPKSALRKQGVVSAQGKGGKRAMRVYPPWDKPTSAQAKKTQLWQLNYYLAIPDSGVVEARVKELFLSE